MVYPRANGDEGVSLFPVNSRYAYVIRDNQLCCSNVAMSTLRYDVFMLMGVWPTHHEHSYARYVCSADSYRLACELVETTMDYARVLHTQ